MNAALATHYLATHKNVLFNTKLRAKTYIRIVVSHKNEVNP
jgi:hypothetical protein